MKRDRQLLSARLDSRGSVLVIVLVTLMFAAFALVAFVERASDDLIVEAREAAGRRLRQQAYSALEVTLGVLEDFRLVNGSLRSPTEGWGEPLNFAGWEPGNGRMIEISFEDESGKLSLPHAELATLTNLFRGWGLMQDDAAKLADGMLGWMRKDHVYSTASQPDYDRGALPYEAPLRSLRSYSELAAIEYVRQMLYDEKGQPNELWHRFVSTVSLFDFKETNLNGLNGTLLSDLGMIDASHQRQLEEFRTGTGDHARQGPGFFESPADAASVLGTQMPPGYGIQISALRINVTVREGRTNFRLSVVVAPSGGATVVKEIATKSGSSDALKGRPVTDATAPKANGENLISPKKLNYPFTLLEIKENAEIPAVFVLPTKA